MTTTLPTKTKKKTETPVEKLPANPFAFEVLQLVSKQRSNAKKVEILKEYEHDSLKSIFIWNFDESVISLLPPGDVPFFGDNTMKTDTLSDRIEDSVKRMGNSNSLGAIDQRYSSIREEYSKFYNFIKGGNDSLSSLRRENIFINLLEGMHPLEAEILCLCKDKKLQEKYQNLSLLLWSAIHALCVADIDNMINFSKEIDIHFNGAPLQYPTALDISKKNFLTLRAKDICKNSQHEFSRRLYSLIALDESSNDNEVLNFLAENDSVRKTNYKLLYV
jgi:hypothetical protein